MSLSTQESDFGFDERTELAASIMSMCRGVDDESCNVVLFYARQLPLASLGRVRELVRSVPNPGVGLVVDALKKEIHAA